METLYHKPMEIESRSMAIIEENLTGVEIPEPERSILKRVIHTTADFDYVENLCFSRDAVSSAKKALQNGAHIVTDTNMRFPASTSALCISWDARRTALCPTRMLLLRRKHAA